MKIVQRDGLPLPDRCTSKVTRMGNVTLVTTYAKDPEPPCIRKVDKDHYVDLRDGQFHEFQHTENRAQCQGSIRRTLEWIRALINTNVTEPVNCRWVTLTYAENMTDQKRLYRDYEKFWKRFLYWCKKQGHGKPEYISVIEPQGRGAWHVHAFFIWEGPAPYIANEDVLEKLWPHGFTTIKQPTDCDNVGAYFSAYLADMPLEEVERMPAEEQEQVAGLEVREVDFKDARELTKTKRFVKGGRLHLYPPGMNIIRRSRGIRDPETEWMTRGQARENASRGGLTFSGAFDVMSDDGRYMNTIQREFYNSKRKG